MLTQTLPSRLDAVLTCLASDPRQTIKQISEATGIPWSSVKRVLAKIDQEKNRPAVSEQSSVPAVGERTGESASGPWVEVVHENPCTLEDLLVVCKVDRKVWQVSRHVVNKWSVGAKQADGSIVQTPLFQIKAFLEKKPGIDTANALMEVLVDIRANPPVEQAQPKNQCEIAVDDPHLLIVNLCDLHFDRLAWLEESGTNWDMKISSSLAIQAVNNLLALTSAFPIRHILYVFGNDLYTADNHLDTTTAGTPQDVDGRWLHSFRRGVKLQHAIIELLRRRASVTAMAVAGNHDTCKTGYLGEVLSAMYSKSSDVTVSNTAQTRKYYRWGTSLFMFTHGNDVKHSALPLIMAGEAGADWSETTHREVFCGHYHHAKATQFNSGDEIGSVRVRILPSLTATDGWHSSKGFVGSKRASEVYIYGHSAGYVGNISWGPKEQRSIEVLRKK
jgi:hypothetical protein